MCHFYTPHADLRLGVCTASLSRQSVILVMVRITDPASSPCRRHATQTRIRRHRRAPARVSGASKVVHRLSMGCQCHRLVLATSVHGLFHMQSDLEQVLLSRKTGRRPAFGDTCGTGRRPAFGDTGPRRSSKTLSRCSKQTQLGPRELRSSTPRSHGTPHFAFFGSTYM